MDYPLTVCVLILSVLCLLVVDGADDEVRLPATGPSVISQVQGILPVVIGNAADIASQSAGAILPEVLENSVPPIDAGPCNTTALLYHFDMCATPERVSDWIKIAKPFIRLMSKIEAPRKKNNRS